MAQFEVRFGPNQAKWLEQSIYAIPDAISAHILIKNGQNPTNSIFPRKKCLLNYINRGSAALGAALLICLMNVEVIWVEDAQIELNICLFEGSVGE